MFTKEEFWTYVKKVVLHRSIIVPVDKQAIQTLARILRYGVKQHEASQQNWSDWQTDGIFIKELFFQYQKRVKSCWVEDLWMLLPY